MACNPPIRTLTLPISAAFSKGGTNPGESDIFVLTASNFVQIAPLLKAIRATLVLDNITQNAQVQVVFQATDDGCTWGANVELLTWVSATGASTSSWHTNVANFKRGIRVGVIVKAATGTAVEMARGTLIVDLELRS